MTDPKTLPVWQNRQQILDALKDNQVTIVESPTGSGKTTQIPLILKEAGFTKDGIIGITQPRRIATLGVCSYIQNQIAKENLDESYCAYKMRFYDTTTEQTKIKILTDGMLLQELKTNSLLEGYSVIMVDEAHERSLNIDFILGLLKQIIEKRDDIKIIISSATLNTKVFSKFFNDAPIIYIDAKTYNVDIKYYPLKKTNDLSELSYSICQILNILLKKFKESSYIDNQDTLVFLTGELDIKTVMQDIYAYCDYSHIQLYPLYGRLNKEEQELVFEETQKQKMKVVLATNIAETSLTIDKIKVVIDSGLAKINYYNQQDFTSSLITKNISKASALQRSGRAGRTSDGICYRLYTKEDFNSRKMYTQEEILRTDLSEVVLRMVDLGITNFESFPFITRPERSAISSGENTLRLIDAITKDRVLTETGKIMVHYPLLPRHSRCIAQALKTDVEIIKNICICVSFLSCKTPFVLPPGEEDQARLCHKRFSSEFGDFIGYQILYEKYVCLESQKKKEDFCLNNYLDFQSMEEIVHVTNQLCSITEELGVPVKDTKVTLDSNFAKRCLVCLSSGLIQYICIRKKGSVYRTLTADEIYIHPGSSWFRNPPMYLLAGEIVMTTKMYARTVSPLESSWLYEVYPLLAQKIKEVSIKKEKSERNIKNNTKYIDLYGKKLEILYDNVSKNRKPVAAINASVLSSIARSYHKASRHPKNINACILFNGYAIAFGERLYDVISLNGRFSLNPSSIIKSLPDEVYYPDTVNNLVPHLYTLLKLSPLNKYKDRLGFVELVLSKNTMFFHVNKSLSEAVNNTAYSLLTIMDENKDNAFKDAYNRIVKLLD